MFGLGLGAVLFCGLVTREVLLVELRNGGGVELLAVLLETGAVELDGGNMPSFGEGGEGGVEVELSGDGGVRGDCEFGERGVVVFPVP